MPKASKFSPDEGLTIYDLKDSEAVHYGDQSKGYVGKNLVYKTLSDYNVYGNANGSEGFWIATGTNGFVAIAKVKKNTNYTLTKDLGNRIRVIGFASEPVINGSHPADPTKYAQLAVGADDLKTLNFNSGIFEYVACNLNSNTAYTGNMNAMVRLASIPDSTYEPYLTPNTEIPNKMSYADNAVLGAKNLLLRYNSDPSNHVTYGLTFINNADGSVTISGVATGEAYHVLNKKPIIGEGVYKLIKGVNNNHISCGADKSDYNGTYIGRYGSTTFAGDEVTIDYNDSELYYPKFWICVKNGADFTTPITVYPMLYIDDDTDNTYQPPTMTNRALTDVILSSVSSATIDIPENGSKTIVMTNSYCSILVITQRNFGGICWNTNGTVSMKPITDVTNVLDVEADGTKNIKLKNLLTGAGKLQVMVISPEPFTVE